MTARTRIIFRTRMILALTTALTLSATFLPAQAGTRSYTQMSTAQSSSHNSGLATVQTPGQSVTTRSVVIPFSKSTVIELPRDLMDVIVSNPDIVESVVHTSRRVVLIGKSPGQTNTYFYGHDGSEILNLEIRVERDMAGLKSLVAEHAGESSVQIQAVNNNILLTGRVPNAAASRKIQRLAELWLDEVAGQSEGEIVNLMTVEGKDQVLLKVRIVEMQRTVTKQLGINLTALGNLGSSTVSLVSNNGLSTGAGFQGTAGYTNAAGGALSSLTGTLSALERVGLIRTKAEPTLVTTSGETANFLSGGEFPLLTNVFIDENGQLQREFEFKPYGVSLGFTPVVLSENRISLNISTEVSEPTTEGSFETGGVGSDILGLRIRRANTVVELPAGGSLVIAGLIREETRQSTDGIPGAKDIPGVGALFRNRDDTNTQTELVIIVTPYLVDPTHPDKLQTPLDGYMAPGDKEALLLGRLNSVYNMKGKGVSAKRLPGPFGHVVD